MENLNNKLEAKSRHITLTCEKYYIFELLIFAAGMMGGYTYNLRGGVFCNAQTANIVLMAISFGKGEFGKGVYYLIPLCAYLTGTVISEVLPHKVRRIHFLRWDTYLVGFEMAILLLIGFLPLTVPVQIVQVTINFICSMQYNTFRQAEGVPMSTTFVTAHVRQIGVWLSRAAQGKTPRAKKLAFRHILMVLSFFSGVLILTLVSPYLKERSIWLALVPLAVSFGVMLYADRSFERNLLEEKPEGH